MNYLPIPSPELLLDTKYYVGTRVRCDFNPNYFLHGVVTRVDADNLFAPYKSCAVMVLYPTRNHPARIITVHGNDTKIRNDDVCRRVCHIPYAIMIPVLDTDIPRAKIWKCNQLHHIPTCKIHIRRTFIIINKHVSDHHLLNTALCFMPWADRF